MNPLAGGGTEQIAWVGGSTNQAQTVDNEQQGCPRIVG